MNPGPFKFKFLLSALVAVAASSVFAQDDSPVVKVQALLHDKAVVQVDGGAPKLLRVGQSLGSVKLLAATPSSALLSINGARRQMNLNVGTLLQPSVISSQVVRPYLPTPDVPAASTSKLEYTADSAGHFHLNLSVNGKSIPAVVDTGATLVVLTEAQAKLAGYTPNDGRPVRAQTANGVALNYHIVLPSLQIGSLKFTNVEAVIAPSLEGGEALLGMSVLRQLQFKQQGNTLTLTALPAARSGSVASQDAPPSG